MNEPRRLLFDAVGENRAAPYRTLGVKPGASPEEIEAAYRAAVRKCPPERDPEGFRRVEQARRELTGLPGIIRKLFGFAWDIPADWACHTARIPPARSSGGSDPSGILSAELFLYAVRALLLDARRMRATQSGRTAAALERVRASVFGAAGTGELPAVSSATVTTYLSFLLPRISLPFKASVVAGKPGRRLTVVSLSVRHPGAQSEGILCAAKVGRGEKLIPLKDVAIDESGQNRELIEDYRCWFLSPGR